MRDPDLWVISVRLHLIRGSGLPYVDDSDVASRHLIITAPQSRSLNLDIPAVILICTNHTLSNEQVLYNLGINSDLSYCFPNKTKKLVQISIRQHSIEIKVILLFHMQNM